VPSDAAMTPREFLISRGLTVCLFVALTLVEFLVIDAIAVAVGYPQPGQGSLAVGLLVYLVPAALAYFAAQSLARRILWRWR
jgi:hypothetical protein